MKGKSSGPGMATVPLLLLSLISSCSARPRSHSHHHNERLPRATRSSLASSESSVIANPTAGFCNRNNILAHAIAGIPLDSEACSPNGSVTESAMKIVIPSSAPTQTVTLEVREEFHWRGWKHGPSRERVTFTRSLGDSVVSKTSKASGELYHSSLARIADHGTCQAPVTTSPTTSSKETTTQSSLDASAGVSFAIQARAVSSSATSTSSNLFAGNYQSFVLSVSSVSSTATSKTSASSTASTSLCPAGNGTTVTSSASKEYQVVCNIDFADNDFPFQLVQTFDDCIAACDAFNTKAGSNKCLAALFVPSRIHDSDDCYLKYSVENPAVATVGIEGAILMTSSRTSTAGTSTSTSSTSATTQSGSTLNTKSSSTSTSTQSSSPQASSSATASSTAPVSQAGVTYASGNSVISPKGPSTKLHGPSQNQPSKQHVQIAQTEALLTLSSSLLTIGPNGDLSVNYDISPNTGALEVNSTTQSSLASLSETPHLSRDGGRGGFLNGEHLFLFCDTGSYTATTTTSNGNFLGFVSSSVATDVGMNGLNGNPLTLQDGIGEWSDNSGRMRSFSPLTRGEEGYNQVMQGQGGRYAIWPESALIPLDATTALIYAPIVYDNVNTATKAAVFTYTGATLLTITAGGKGGPVAVRANKKIFMEDEVEWGCAGGIRSWGASGIGGSDGSVYLFGNVNGGILLARTSPSNVADRGSYEYWDGHSWGSGMQSSTSKAYFIDGPIMDIDVFYSPRHLTFIAVYLTIYADSTFYYRYLEADQAILPPYAPGGDKSSDVVENILKYTWSAQQVLYKAATGLSGNYIYSGGVHANYYGSNDIINGGSKMLISWTAPTGLDPSTKTSEYQIVTAEVDWP